MQNRWVQLGLRAALATLVATGMGLSSCGGDDAPSPVSPDDSGTVDSAIPDGGSSDSAIDSASPDAAGDAGDAGDASATNEVSAVVTPAAGGTITLGTTTVTVPPGAVAAPTTITVKTIAPSTVAPLPAGATGVGPMVALLPHGLTFTQPVSVTLGYTSTAPRSTLTVLSLDNEQDPSWKSVSAPTFSATSVTFQTSSFSIKLPTWTGATLLYNDPGPAFVGHIALGGGKLFYARSNPVNMSSVIEIRSINVDGSGPAAVSSFPLADGMTNAMLTTPTTLFFAAGQSLYAVPLAGGTTTSTAVPCAAGSLDAFLREGIPRLVADATQLYCTTVAANGFGELKSITTSGALVTAVPNLMAPTTVVTDGTDLLYAAFGGVFRTANTLTGTATNIIASAEFGTGFSVTGITHDATFLYVLTTSTAGKAVLWRKPRAGGALQPITVPLDIAQGGARGLLIAGANVYFARKYPTTGQDSGSVLHRIAKTATSAVPLTWGGANQSTVISDGTYVYYSNGTELLRIPQ